MAIEIKQMQITSRISNSEPQTVQAKASSKSEESRNSTTQQKKLVIDSVRQTKRILTESRER